MKKQLFKNILIFSIIILLTSCSEELYEEELDASKNKTSIKEMKFDKLFKDKKFNTLLNKVTNYKAGNNSNTARSTFENQNGFTISNEIVKIITYDSLTSYTMLVERDSLNSQSTGFENLVIQETNLGDNVKAFLIKYMPNQIIPTTHNSFTFEGTIQKSKLAFTGFNRGASENTIQSDCYVDVLMCNESWSGGVAGTSHVAGEGCKNIRFLSVRKVKVLCADGSGGGGGDSGGDSSGDSGGFGDPYGGGGAGGGTGSSDPNDSEAEEDVITSPVTPGLDGEVSGKTPCSELAKLTGDIANKEAIETLQTKTTENKEYGYSVSKNSDNIYNVPEACSSPVNNPDQINMPVGGNKIGAFHTHPYVLSTNTTNVVPMFSDGDLNWLFWVANQHTNNGEPKEYSEYFLTLTVPQGTFAIKIKDILKFNSFRNNNTYWKNVNSSGTVGELPILRKLYDDIGPDGNFNSLTTSLLKVLSEADTGIGLYEASSDLSTWSELTLTATNYIVPESAPIKKPCL